MVGFDMYHQNPAEGGSFIDSFKAEMNIVQEFASQHNKLFAVTETGVANKDNSVFANQMGDYTKLDVDVEPNNGVSGVITAPASGNRILKSTIIEANVINAGDTSNVKFILKNKTGSVVKELDTLLSGRGIYYGSLTNGILNAP